jgi:hypothetical protein
MDRYLQCLKILITNSRRERYDHSQQIRVTRMSKSRLVAQSSPSFYLKGTILPTASINDQFPSTKSLVPRIPSLLICAMSYAPLAILPTENTVDKDIIRPRWKLCHCNRTALEMVYPPRIILCFNILLNCRK